MQAVTPTKTAATTHSKPPIASAFTATSIATPTKTGNVANSLKAPSDFLSSQAAQGNNVTQSMTVISNSDTTKFDLPMTPNIDIPDTAKEQLNPRRRRSNASIPLNDDEINNSSIRTGIVKDAPYSFRRNAKITAAKDATPDALPKSKRRSLFIPLKSGVSYIFRGLKSKKPAKKPKNTPQQANANLVAIQASIAHGLFPATGNSVIQPQPQPKPSRTDGKTQPALPPNKPIPSEWQAPPALTRDKPTSDNWQASEHRNTETVNIFQVRTDESTLRPYSDLFLHIPVVDSIPMRDKTASWVDDIMTRDRYRMLKAIQMAHALVKFCIPSHQRAVHVAPALAVTDPLGVLCVQSLTIEGSSEKINSLLGPSSPLPPRRASLPSPQGPPPPLPSRRNSMPCPHPSTPL